MAWRSDKVTSKKDLTVTLDLDGTNTYSRCFPEVNIFDPDELYELIEAKCRGVSEDFIEGERKETLITLTENLKDLHSDDSTASGVSGTLGTGDDTIRQMLKGLGKFADLTYHDTVAGKPAFKVKLDLEKTDYGGTKDITLTIGKVIYLGYSLDLNTSPMKVTHKLAFMGDEDDIELAG